LNEPDPAVPPLARHVRAALDESVARLDTRTRERLFEARQQAMRALPARHAGGSVLALSREHPWLTWSLAGALLMAAAIALQQWRAGPGDAELDILMLTDDIPPQAFVDWELVRREHVGALCLVAD
jgi:hypothetical protein